MIDRKDSFETSSDSVSSKSRQSKFSVGLKSSAISRDRDGAASVKSSAIDTSQRLSNDGSENENSLLSQEASLTSLLAASSESDHDRRDRQDSQEELF